MPNSDTNDEARSGPAGGVNLSFVRALRPHHWLKNLLVFVPAIAGHRFSVPVFGTAAVACFCFCLAASAGYLVNDLLDTSSDREHVRKRSRPIASGTLPLWRAASLAVALSIAALLVALQLSLTAAAVTAAYLLVSLAYSAFFKRQPIADVIVLAGLFTLRVAGGGAATGIPLSKWLIIFSLFLFLSLAIAKRCSEIAAASGRGDLLVQGRGYRTDDLPLLLSLGVAAGYGSVLAVALYVASPEVGLLYSHIERLWFAVPLLIYWVSRVLFLASRGELDEDPVVFAATDPVTWLVGIGVAAVAAAAT